MFNKIIPLEVYTDGSCKKRGIQTFGGWAYIIVRDGDVIAKYGDGEPNTTNQRMELLAAIEGLKIAEKVKTKDERIIVYSDSAYLINCYLQEWYKNWQRNGWQNANKKEVANQDLWEQLIPYFELYQYSFSKVKGHSTNIYNNMCDEIAQRVAEEAKTNWRGFNNE